MHAELENDAPGVVSRCVKVIGGIKRAVAAMRSEAEGATCYREKCSIILSTAIGASVALDQAIFTFPYAWLSQPPTALHACKHVCSLSVSSGRLTCTSEEHSCMHAGLVLWQPGTGE